jgi:mannose-6-phosphate isomerase-like protein (cupin superfamily)
MKILSTDQAIVGDRLIPSLQTEGAPFKSPVREAAFASVICTDDSDVLDLFGATVQFLTDECEEETAPCLLRGTIPPGVSVPMHSHADYETFYVLSGEVQVLTEHNGQSRWLPAKTGDVIQIPGGAVHAFRNQSKRPVEQLFVTTMRLGRFFREIGRPMSAAGTAPHPEELQNFITTSAHYGYWLATPEENAAVGINLP